METKDENRHNTELFLLLLKFLHFFEDRILQTASHVRSASANGESSLISDITKTETEHCVVMGKQRSQISYLSTATKFAHRELKQKQVLTDVTIQS